MPVKPNLLSRMTGGSNPFGGAAKTAKVAAPRSDPWGGLRGMSSSGAPVPEDRPYVPPEAKPAPVHQPKSSPQVKVEPLGPPAIQPATGGIYNEFMNEVRKGVTNPYGLAAISATGQRESGYSPRNSYGHWNDPSERGVAGTAGGVMSWRGPRYEAMKRAGGEKSAAAQGKFMLTENPKLIAQLNAAKSVEEAQTLMNNAWQFAGYNRAGGEALARMKTARAHYARFASGNPGPETVVEAGSPMQPDGWSAFRDFQPTSEEAPAEAPKGARQVQANSPVAQLPGAGGVIQRPVSPDLQEYLKSKSTRHLRALGPAATISVLAELGAMSNKRPNRE